MANFSGGFDTSPTPNASAFTALVFTVVTAGTPVNLTALAVPDGFSAVFRAHRSNGNKIIYLANSSVNTADPTKRVELRAGEIVQLTVDDLNLVWIDATANASKLEVAVEQ